jgi:hypothetical protein
MNGVEVLELLRMKERSGVRHEYFAVLVKIRYIGDALRYVRIERAGGDLVETPLSPHGNGGSSSALLKSSKARVANDTVVTLENLPKGDDRIETVQVRASNIRLIDIAIAAKVVHDHDGQYRLLKGQCFWFSDMIMRILEKQFTRGVGVDDAEHFRHLAEHLTNILDQPGAFTPAWKAQMYSVEGGKWTWIPIYKPRMEHINQVAATLRQELDKFAEKVQYSLHMVIILT